MAEDKGKEEVETTISEERDKEEEEKGEKIEEMKPWEQHSAVISIPRYDYNASSSLLRNSHSGFLITCPISQFSLTFPKIFEFFINFLSIFHFVRTHNLKVGSEVWLLSKQLSLVL